jgi:transcriptional regulator with XRE-family HTH domain
MSRRYRLHSYLKAMRLGRGLTRGQLATATGLSVSYLCDLESGRTEPTLRTLVKLADAFHVTVGYMLIFCDLGEKFHQTDEEKP